MKKSDSLVLRSLVDVSTEDIDWPSGHGVRSGTVDSYVGKLAAAIDMDAATLESSITQHNKSCSVGEDRDFDKDSACLNVCNGNSTVYAIEVKNSAGKVMGAIRANRDFSVVQEDGRPIVDLYAAGVESTMIWANVYAVSISGY